MEVESELDGLMIAAQQTLSLSRDAEERVARLREEVVLLESELSRNEEIARALARRLKELAVRVGLVSPDDLALRDAENLDEIESVIDDRRQQNHTRPIPQNVIFLAKMAREQAKKVGDATVEPVEEVTLADALTQALASLTPREAKVLRLRYGLGVKTCCTLAEVGKQFGITGERIRQIEAKALRKLRWPSRSEILRPHLGSLDLNNIRTPEAKVLLAVFGYR